MKGISTGHAKAKVECIAAIAKYRTSEKPDVYPGLIPKPDSIAISQDQLAAEVEGIYAGLVMVEAKCIKIDAAQASDRHSHLGPEQWQALVALHRTLLYEHHDFLMATQHPSATPALQGLATKYSMPARVWKHGIHAFLEILRHRKPESQDHMLAFIYLAYQMMALLFETVPSFTDTWIECLGDLARYRMAIEEEKEAHAVWGGVAARWYTLASDRHPAIGQLYHHLGMLERPSLRKLSLYAKSLSFITPFPNARDSLSALCRPIVVDEVDPASRARFLPLAALASAESIYRTSDKAASNALRLLLLQHMKLREFGAYFVLTNVAAIFELRPPIDRCCWKNLAHLLNALAGDVLLPNPKFSSLQPPEPDARPLSEDYLIRGINWTQFYFPPRFLDGQHDEEDTPRDRSLIDQRAERALWLGLYLAFQYNFPTPSHVHKGWASPKGSMPSQEHDKSLLQDLSSPLSRTIRALLERVTGTFRLGPILLASCAAFLPIVSASSTDAAGPSQPKATLLRDWVAFIITFTAPIVVAVCVAWAGFNIRSIVKQQCSRPPLSAGRLSIAASVLYSILNLTAPEATGMAFIVGSLWIALWTDYMARMWVRLEQGEFFFWLSTIAGCFASFLLNQIVLWSPVKFRTSALPR